jgi:hypothetical protein
MPHKRQPSVHGRRRRTSNACRPVRHRRRHLGRVDAGAAPPQPRMARGCAGHGGRRQRPTRAAWCCATLDPDPHAADLRRLAQPQGGADRNPPAGHAGAVVEPLGWQLRLRVALALETAGLRVSSRWARLKMTPGAPRLPVAAAAGQPAGPPGAAALPAARQPRALCACCRRRSRPWTGWNCMPTATAARASTPKAGAG